MTQAFTIPGGKEKGVALHEATDGTLSWWADKISENLGDGTSRNPDRDQQFVAAMRAELSRRGSSPKPAQKAPQKAPPPASPAPAQKPAGGSSLAVRGSDQLSGSFSDAKEANDALRKALEDYILVSPATHCGALPEGCGVAISLVFVNTDSIVEKGMTKYPAGEVNEIGGKLMLSATVLKRIAAAASIDWDDEKSGRTDDGSDPHYCSWLAVGWVKNFDGSKRRISGNADIDTRENAGGEAVGAAAVEIRTKAEARRREHPDWKNDGGDSQLLELRKFLARQTETKAKNRAVADMGVPRALTKEQLKKPFAVARLMWTGQTRDPELKREFALRQMDNMMGASSALYGKSAPQQSAAPALPAGRQAPPMGSIAQGDYQYIDSPSESEPEPQQPQQQPQQPPTQAQTPAQTQAPAQPPTQPPTREPGDDTDDLPT